MVDEGKNSRCPDEKEKILVHGRSPKSDYPSIGKSVHMVSHAPNVPDG